MIKLLKRLLRKLDMSIVAGAGYHALNNGDIY